MRRSICYCEPGYALAGQTTTWKFVYTPPSPLKKGARLKFDLMSKGRYIDWEIPDSDLKNKNAECVIYAITESAKTPLKAREVDTPDGFFPQYEFTLPADMKPEESFTIVMGLPKGSRKKEGGNRCQTTLQRRRSFLLFVDPKGKGNYEDPEIFSLDIRGNVLHNIRIIAPSVVEKNKRFDVIIRFEDEFGNLTSHAPEDTLVELSYENQRENLNWKLFVPETGFITVPNFYFNEAGTYKIQLLNLGTKERFYSSPIKCFQENKRQIFWGLFHGESERVDSTENIETCLRYFRDDLAMNFYSSSPFESNEETPNEIWKLVTQNVADFNEDDRFSCFLGFQWQGEPDKEGVRQILFTKDNKALLRKKDSKYSSLKKLYKSLSPKEAISIPCFTMGKSMGFSFENFNPDFERVVEIYNAWGSSECLQKESNQKPILCHKKGITESVEGSIQNALLNNKRFGFVAGGLDDRGAYTDFFESDQEQYSPGLTAIFSTDHNREALVDALYSRSCYATTGERMIVDFHLSGMPMGSEISTREKPGLRVNRHLSGFVAGTDQLKSVEIIRNSKVIASLEPNDYSYEFSYDDLEALSSVTATPPNGSAPFAYYYLRVTQNDGHIAWSSPIWVDDPVEAKAKK